MRRADSGHFSVLATWSLAALVELFSIFFTTPIAPLPSKLTRYGVVTAGPVAHVGVWPYRAAKREEAGMNTCAAV